MGTTFSRSLGMDLDKSLSGRSLNKSINKYINK